MKVQHCSISVTGTQIYTNDRCVKKLVRSWQFTIRYDTIESLTWPRKPSIQLYLAHVARN